MAKTRQSNTNRTKRHKTSNVYMYDNTARNLQIQRQLEEQPKKKLSHEARKNRDKAHHMSLGYVLFLVAALGTCAMILINYVQLQAELTTKIQHVARQESELNSLRQENDEAYNRIISSIDLEEIKRIAIGELGMVYPQEGQIILYSNEGRDYVRKVDSGNYAD